ncbi:response regulator transcription factor [Trinickia violacea]|uniref:response regulator transcription factor n=1 Tax=Trinickia violacea TaxID=2571746 RepID=UPI0015867DD8|nr:response regulator transcription factor [Trinickia violacea]
MALCRGWAACRIDVVAPVSFLRRRYWQSPIVTVTMLKTPAVFRALLQLGVQCIASKFDAMSRMIAAVHAAHSQGHYLSPKVRPLVLAEPRLS